MRSDKEIMKRARKLVAKQAEDEGLWFRPHYASEDYLQTALRLLHAVIEDANLPGLVLVDEILKSMGVIE